MACSDLTIYWGGEFVIYSPSESQNRTRCAHSCMRLQAWDIRDGKLTSLAMQGVQLDMGLPCENVSCRHGFTMQGMHSSLNLAHAGDEVVLEYRHPGKEPPKAGFIVRIASIMQVQHSN